jgi:hypothetical protein
MISFTPRKNLGLRGVGVTVVTAVITLTVGLSFGTASAAEAPTSGPKFIPTQPKIEASQFNSGTDKKPKVVSPNPFLSYLPTNVRPDYEPWLKIMQTKAKQLRTEQIEARVAAGYSPTAFLAVNEAESSGVIGVNDSPFTAEYIAGFGTGDGDDGEADVDGNLQPSSLTPDPLSLNAEDDGDINKATVTGLLSNTALAATGTIGDGPFGSAQLPVSGIDVSVEPNGTLTDANAIAMTPQLALVEVEAVIGDGAYGSGGTGEGDFDIYSIPVTTGQWIQVVALRTGGDTTFRPVIALFDSAGVILDAADDTGSEGTAVLQGVVEGPPETWYIAVGGNVNFDATPDFNDFPSDLEDPLTGPGAGSEGTYQLQVIYPMPGDFDVLEFDALAGDIIVIEVDTDGQVPGELDPIVGLFDSAGNVLLDDFGFEAINDDDPNASGPDSSTDSYLTHTIAADGTYYAFIGAYTTFPPDVTAFPSNRFDSSTGPFTGSEGDYDVVLGRFTQDVDFYSFDLEAGDIIGANITGPTANFLSLWAPDGGTLLAATPFDTAGAHPPASQLPLGGNSSFGYIVNAPGTYFMGVLSGFDDYTLELRSFRPPQEATRTKQRVFLDFDGEEADTSVFGSTIIPANQPVTLSPLSAFLSNWGLTPGDEDAVIDAIVATVEQRLSAHIKSMGMSDIFNIEILNSRDHADPWGDADVSRIIIGGTIAESGIDTIGIAQSVDLGNFDQAEDSLVLLDNLSDPNSLNPNSLNSFTLDASKTIIDLIGDGVGKIAVHEAGHFFANWHTTNLNLTYDIMDEGGDLAGLIGVGPDAVFGTPDDIDVNFGTDTFSINEAFIGVEDTLNNMSYGLPGPPDVLPLLVPLPDINSDSIEDLAVLREGSIIAEIRSGTNGALQRNIEFFMEFAATPVTAVALPDSDGNGVHELAVLATRDSDGRAVAEIQNLSGDPAPRYVWFAADHTPVAMTVVDDDADGNGVVELATLSRRDSDGRGKVEVKNAFGPTNPKILWAGAGLTSTDVEVVGDKDSNGIPEIAILSTRDSDGRIVAEIKNAAGATLPTAVWFAPGHTAIDMVAVDDKDSNGIPEVAVLSRRDSDGRNVVEIKNAAGPTAPVAVWFAPGMTATEVRKVNDADSNGVPEVAVLSVRDSDGRILVEVKNVFGATNPNPIWYSPGYTARGLATIADTDSNSVEEALVLMIRDSDGRILVQGRNASGSPAPNNYWFSP